MLKKLPLKVMIALLILTGLVSTAFMAQYRISASWDRYQDAHRMEPLSDIVGKELSERVMESLFMMFRTFANMSFCGRK